MLIKISRLLNLNILSEMRFLTSIIVGAFVIAASGSPFWGFVAFFVFWVISDND